jgi:hypothetical protein
MTTDYKPLTRNQRMAAMVNTLSETTGRTLHMEKHSPGDGTAWYQIKETVNENGGQRHYGPSLRISEMESALMLAVAVACDLDRKANR